MYDGINRPGIYISITNIGRSSIDSSSAIGNGGNTPPPEKISRIAGSDGATLTTSDGYYLVVKN